MKTLIPVKFSMRNFGAYSKQDIVPSKSGNLTIVGANGQGKSVLMTSFFPLLFTGVLKGNKNFDTTTPANAILKRNEANSKNYRTFNDTLLGKGLINLDRRIGYVYVKLQSDERTVVLGIGADVDIDINNTMPVKAWHFVIEETSDFEFEPPVNPNNPYESANLADFKKYLNSNFPNAYLTNQQTEYQQYVSEHIFGFKTTNDLKQYVRFVRTIGSSNLTAGGQNGVSINMIHNLYRSVQDPIKETYISELLEPNKSIYRSRQNIEIANTVQNHLVKTHQSIAKVKLATLINQYEALLQNENSKEIAEATKSKKEAELQLGQTSLEQANSNIEDIQSRIESLQSQRANFSNIETQKKSYSKEITELTNKKAQIEKLQAKAKSLSEKNNTIQNVDLIQTTQDKERAQSELTQSIGQINDTITIFNTESIVIPSSEQINTNNIKTFLVNTAKEFNKFKQNLNYQKQFFEIKSAVDDQSDNTADELSEALNNHPDSLSDMVIEITNQGYDTLSTVLIKNNPQIENEINNFKQKFGNIEPDTFETLIAKLTQQLKDYERILESIRNLDTQINQLEQLSSKLNEQIEEILDSINVFSTNQILNISEINDELDVESAKIEKLKELLSNINSSSLENIDAQINSEKVQLKNANKLATSWISNNAKAQTIIESSENEINSLDIKINNIQTNLSSALQDLNKILPDNLTLNAIKAEFEDVSDKFATQLNIPKTTIASILHGKANLDRFKEKMYKMISDTYQLSGLDIVNITPQNFKNDSSEIVDLLKQISEFIKRQEQTLASNTNRNDDAIKSYLQATQSAIRRRQDFIDDLTKLLKVTNQNQEIQIDIDVSKNDTIPDKQLQAIVDFDGHDYDDVTFISDFLNKIMSDASTSDLEKDNILKSELDYRSWFDFDFKISRNHGASFELITDDFIGGNNSGSATGSGAEKSKAIMIPMLILPMMLLNSANKEDTPHILTLDEIGNKLDSRVTQGILHTLDELGFSYMATTPLADKDKLLADDIDNEFIQVHAFKELNEKFPDAIAFNTIESIGSWN